jgi:hypothetical protein
LGRIVNGKIVEARKDGPVRILAQRFGRGGGPSGMNGL